MPAPSTEAGAQAAVSLVASDLAKGFGARGLFRGVTFELAAGQSLAVTGRNGSGKSTLLRILCGLIRPTQGSVEYRIGEKVASSRQRRGLIGLVAPDLALYEELTALENLRFIARVRGLKRTDAELGNLLAGVGLESYADSRAGVLSSGTRQRLRYAFALLHRPPVLFLDEPTANLDEAGIAIAHACMVRQRAGGILVVATNNRDELQYGDRVLRLGR